ncbi:MAG TPA: MFS transporter [Candidatus Limnocylindrales bacterium]|nr:MFS transporter [Candidatus Limnocylindrales bacterium]
MRAYRRLLRRRAFALLWTGATISALGDGLSWIALVWLLLELGGSSGSIGLLVAAYTGPVIVSGLVAGHLLDRFDRRRVLIVDNVIRGLAIASIPILSATGNLATWQLYAVAIVYGSLFMISLAGVPTLIASLVPDDELTTANAMETMSYAIGGLAGPALAGLLIGVFGASNVLLLDAASYGAFALCLVAMRAGLAADRDTAGDHDPPTASAVAQRDGGHGFGQALRFVRRTPAILAITLMFMAFNVGEGMVTVMLPVYVREVIGGNATAYGLLATSFAAGILAGSFIVGAVHWRWPLGRSIAAAQATAGAVLLGLAFRPDLFGAAAVLAGSGFAASSLTAWAQTIRMRLIPAELRGRVFALLRTLMQSTPPIGGLLAGFMLTGGQVTGVAIAVAVLIALPGAVGSVIPALGREATGEAEPAGAIADAGS